MTTDKVDRHLSEVLALSITGRGIWVRTVRAVLNLRPLRRARYVEGAVVVLPARVPTEHCWIELGNKIVDLGLHEFQAVYFTARSLTREELKEWVRTNRRVPVFKQLAPGEIHQALQPAWDQAKRYCRRRKPPPERSNEAGD